MNKADSKSRVVTTYCLTGSFISGTRRDVAAVLEGMGCRVVEDVSRSVDFLLVGAKISAGNSTIQAALDLLYGGHGITVLHELHWLRWMDSDQAAASLLQQAKGLDDARAFKRPPSKAKGVLWEGAQMVRFEYRDSKGEKSERDVRLQKVTGEADGRPAALVGYCMLRKMSRTFKAGNVVSLELIDDQLDSDLQAVLARL